MMNSEVFGRSASLTLRVCFRQSFYAFCYASACGPFMNRLWFLIYLRLAYADFVNRCGSWGEQPQLYCFAFYPYPEGHSGSAMPCGGCSEFAQCLGYGHLVFGCQVMAYLPEYLGQYITKCSLWGRCISVVVHPSSDLFVHFQHEVYFVDMVKLTETVHF